jgi:drug/metabolite transporter (DMT)-like permease
MTARATTSARFARPFRVIAAAWLRMTPNTRGILWALMFCTSFACADAFAKHVARDFDVFVLLFLRYVLSLIILAPVAFHVGLQNLRTARPAMHFFRTILSAAGQLLAYYAILNMLLADFTAINLARPLFVTLLAVLLVAEQVTVGRWIATAVGFAGVLVMVQPGAHGVDLAALTAVASTIMFALSLILVRYYRASESPIKFVLYYHAIGALLMLPLALYFWQTPTWEETLFIALIAVTGTAAQTFGIRAYSVGEASVVSPIEYFRLIAAAAIGLFVFVEWPGANTWIGAAIVIASQIYINRRAARARAAGRSTGQSK